MRILHLVTMVSPSGAYGGPTTVAFNQVRELERLGHEVTIAAAQIEFESPPARLHNVRTHLFRGIRAIPQTGFAGLIAPSMLRWLHKEICNFDVLHVHLARDLVTLPAIRLAQFCKTPTFIQTHGMIDSSDKALAGPLDMLLTRPAFRAAHRIFYLTLAEAELLTAQGAPRQALTHLPNGVPAAACAGVERSSDKRRVLFVARLHARKRPMHFVRMAEQLCSEGITAEFVIAGPDEGMAREVDEHVRKSVYRHQIRVLGHVAPQAVPELMASAALYVLPSVNEPYPMTVLEAMAQGVPVVVTKTCGLAPEIGLARAGMVVEDSLEALTDGVRRLLTEADLRVLGTRGQEYVAKHRSMNAVAETLVSAYSSALWNGK